MNNLDKLDVERRPIHCSDVKRLQFYVKDDDRWDKDNNNIKMDVTIDKIDDNNYVALDNWKQRNPDYKKHDDPVGEKFCKMVVKMTKDKGDKKKVLQKIAHKYTVKKAIRCI